MFCAVCLPFHLEYMRNMGTLSSMSVSIIYENRTLGPHQRPPRGTSPGPVSYTERLRHAYKNGGNAADSIPGSIQATNEVQFHEVRAQDAGDQIASENDYVSALTSQVGALIDVQYRAGVVLAIDGYLDTDSATLRKWTLCATTDRLARQSAWS